MFTLFKKKMKLFLFMERLENAHEGWYVVDKEKLVRWKM